MNHSAQPEAAKTGFNVNIHGARGLFSLMIFVFHTYFSGLRTFPIFASDGIATWILPSMKFGVELFFGISGVVIVGALTRAPSIRFFVWERMTRIFPVLWVALLTIIALSTFSHRQLPSLPLLAANFVAPPPFFDVPLVHPAAWSLGYEFTFYMLCAIVWILRDRGFAFWLPLACLVGAFLIILYPRAILMPAGVLIAAGAARISWLERWSKYPVVNLTLFIAGWRAIDLALDGHITHASPLWISWEQWLGYAPLLVGAGIFGSVGLLGIHEGYGWLSRLLRTKFMLWMGTISYSFYLWHPIIMSMTKQAMHHFGITKHAGEWAQVALFAIALPPALLVSRYSQIVLEKHLTRLLRRSGRKRASAQPPVTADAVN